MENASESLDDPLNATTVEDAERFSEEHKKFAAEVSQRSADPEALVALAGQMHEANVTDFSGITMEDLSAKFQATVQAGEKRKVAIHEELEKQKKNDAISREFAQRAKALNTYMEQERSALASLKGSLQDQLNAVMSQSAKYEKDGKVLLKALEDSNAQVESAGAKTKRHTNLNFRELKTQFEQLKNILEKQDKDLSSEIFAKKSGDVTPEQLKEFKEVFQHFDKDNSGTLNKLEFKACLQSLGEDFSDATVDSIMSDGTGNINFETFLNFMINKTKDQDTQGEMLESFKAIANDKEFVTEEDLRRVLSNDKADFLIKNMPRNENGLDYAAWVNQQYKK